MSSARHNTLGSAVFQRTLLASAGFILVSLALLWLICGTMVWRVDRQVDGNIRDMSEYAQEVYYGRGAEALIAEEIVENDQVIWHEDLIQQIRDDGQLIWVLRGPDYEPNAGYPGLHGDLGWSRTWLDHPELGQEVRSYRVALRGGDTMAIAAFIPESRADILSFGILGSLALLLIVLPMAVITGYAVSKGVFRRIEEISTTAAAVGSGQMASRAPTSGRHDEFDRLAASINRMLDEVAALNKNIESVSVGVAHDLRTPLTNIGGRLELIRRDAGDATAVTDHVSAAEAAQAQLMRIFDALLRLGEVKAGRRRAAFAPVNLSGLMQDMVDTYDPVFSEADKTFTASVEPGLSVPGDRELLEQMLANLLENAVEHSRAAARVFANLSLSDGAIILRVGDDGPGISPADRDRIFDRFFRADASRSTPGNGLGLSLVHAIAELHDATVTLDPAAKGAVFVVRFAAA